MVNTIIKEVDDLKSLVDEFSLYARLPKANLEPADINALIGEVVSLYKNAHRNINFIEHLQDDLPKVSIDGRQMKRAFMNIIENAVYSVNLKYLEKIGEDYKPEIRIFTELIEQGDKESGNKNLALKISFSDNGTGINDEIVQNIYEPYFSTKQGGTGLGLAITKNILMENNAQILVENNERGGADFIIFMPLQ